MNKDSIIGSLLNRINGKDDAELAADEPKRNPFPNGPVKFKPVTNGQIRRGIARDRARGARKANLRYRRSWLQAQQRQAGLRGRLQVVGALPFADEGFAVTNDALYVNALQSLVDDFGGVDQALEVYRKVQEREAAETRAQREQEASDIPVKELV